MERLEKDDFLQISKAIEIFDTSYSSVQRLCRKEKAGKRVKKKSNKYVIQYSLLNEHFDLKDSAKIHTPPHVEKDLPNNTAGSVGAVGVDNRLINTLNSQIDFLTSQINSKDSQIDKLLQRQSEQNIIIQTLQNNLSTKIDSSVPLLIDSIKEVRNVPTPATTPPPAESDNGFTVASAVLILLLVALLILFVSK